MKMKPYLFLNRLLLLVMVVLWAGSGCIGSRARTLETAGPTIKPPPAETLTTLVGYKLSDLFLVLGTSLIAALVAGALLVAAATFLRYQTNNNYLPSLRRLSLATVFFFIGAFALQTLTATTVTVPSGEIGVRLRYGAAQPQVLEPGLHWLTPYVEQAALLSTREFVYIATSHVDTASEDFVDYKVGARTCDGVEAEIPYTIKFKLMPGSAPELFAEYGSLSAAQERVVKAVSRQVVREVPTQFSSIALYVSSAVVDNPDSVDDHNLREFLADVPCGDPSTGFDTLNEEIRRELAGEFESAGLMLTFFGVRQPDLGDFGESLDRIRIATKDAEVAQIEERQAETLARAEAAAALAKAEAEGDVAIEEAKAVAETERLLAAAQAEAARIQAESEAEVAAIQAESQAEIAQVKAEADASRIEVEAEAEAERNRLLAESLTPELTSFLLQQAMFNRWDGRMPILGTLDGVTPFLEIPPELIRGEVESGSTTPEPDANN